MARDYAKFSPRFWTGETGKKLRTHPNAQRLAAYLITSTMSTMTGLYYLPMPIIGHEIGMTEADVAESFAYLASIEFAFYDANQDLVWVPSMAEWQIDEALQPGDKRIKGIKRELDSFRWHPFVLDFWKRYGAAFHLGDPPSGTSNDKPLASPFEAPCKPLRSQDQDQEQEQKQEITPPARDPTPTVWLPYHWFMRFGAAWGAEYNREGYVGGGDRDSKASGDLGGILAELSPKRRLEAQERAQAMFAEFLGDKKPDIVDARHPWSWFVGRFKGLLVDKKPLAKNTGPPRNGTQRTDEERRKTAVRVPADWKPSA